MDPEDLVCVYDILLILHMLMRQSAAYAIRGWQNAPRNRIFRIDLEK